MLKLPVEGGTVTLRSIRVIPMECAMISGPNTQHPVTSQVLEEKIKVAIHPEYPEQTIAIGSTLTEKGRKELCVAILQAYVFTESLCGYPFKCFLDAYKGYHQIKRAEEDEEKTAFITSQGIFCYSKMSFGLKNTRATYQRLVDRAFQKQIGRNLEEGMFLGYKVNADGLKVCPDKADAVLSLPSPGCLKDVQKLNGKLASLNRFLSKSAEKSLPFFKTLKKCTKKSDFQWTQEAEVAFRQMKKLIADLPMLTAPKEREELIMYLAATKEAISAVLMTEREGKQMPVYFVSRALRGAEINYTPMEKLVLALLSASRRLKRYFQAYTIVVIIDQPIKQLLSNSKITGRMLKWKFELEGHDIQYRLRILIKGQILVDFIMERPEEESPDELMVEPEELPEP
ncbi:reverse transcriptase domain-containing protein [Tanacetum coccineum]|uniref:Reverse transcriptase domain-containing protein n=1 Tax=Tanacetum coccineum TaxID=301880 RepID=A0ABQ5E0G1_9ASTR